MMYQADKTIWFLSCYRGREKTKRAHPAFFSIGYRKSEYACRLQKKMRVTLLVDMSFHKQQQTERTTTHN